MHQSIRLRGLRAAVLLSLLVFLGAGLSACGGHYGRPDKSSSQLAFGVDMAKHGLWSEALFRFLQAERLDPNNARIQNNLGVAYEAAGAFDKALEAYRQALRLDPNSRESRANYARFVEFYQGFKPADQTTPGGPAVAPVAPGTAASPSVPSAPGTASPPAGNRPPGAPPAEPAGSPMGVPEPTAPEPPPPPPPSR